MPSLNEILTQLIYKLCAPKLTVTLHQKIINKTGQEKVIDKRCVTATFPVGLYHENLTKPTQF